MIGNFEFVAKTKILLENLENYPKGKVVLELILVHRKAGSKREGQTANHEKKYFVIKFVILNVKVPQLGPFSSNITVNFQMLLFKL